MRFFINKSTLLIVLTIFTLISCAHEYTTQNDSRMFQRTSLDQVYNSSGFEQYYLNEIPSWYNVSSSGNCEKSYSVKYFDINKLRNSFSLSYENAINLQYLYNVELQKYSKKQNVSTATLKEEEIIFQTVLDQVQSGVKGFPLPDYNRVNLIWIDSYLSKTSELNKLMESEDMNLGHPVFLSLCLSNSEMEKFLVETKLDEKNIKFITYEALSIYNSKNRKNYLLQLDLKDFFKKEQQLHLYLNKQSRPLEFKGDFTLHK